MGAAAETERDGKGTLFCKECQSRTGVDKEVRSHARCGVCGADFTCNRCGFQVDHNGRCIRHNVTGFTCGWEKW